MLQQLDKCLNIPLSYILLFIKEFYYMTIFACGREREIQEFD